MKTSIGYVLETLFLIFKQLLYEAINNNYVCNFTCLSTIVMFRNIKLINSKEGVDGHQNYFWKLSLMAVKGQFLYKLYDVLK